MNRLTGQLIAMESCDGIHLLRLSVDNLPCTAMAIGEMPPQPSGGHITLGVRALDIAIGRNLTGQMSLRNRLPCQILALQHGQLMTSLSLQLASQQLEAIITRHSTEAMQLAVGMDVEAIIKSSALFVLHDDA